MELSGKQDFSASPQAVWDALHNASVLQNAAGVADVQWTDSALTATVTLPAIAGPFAGTRTVSAEVVENSAPSHLKLALNRGPVSAVASIDIAANGSGSTVSYTATATVNGPMGSMVETMGKPVIDGQLSQFFAKLAQSI